MIDRKTAVDVVTACVKDALAAMGTTGEVTEETTLVGPGALLDSISVVSLIVDVEQRLEMEHHLSVTLASDRAMSQRNSPFRTAGVLADHILATAAQDGANA